MYASMPTVNLQAYILVFSAINLHNFDRLGINFRLGFFNFFKVLFNLKRLFANLHPSFFVYSFYVRYMVYGIS